MTMPRNLRTKILLDYRQHDSLSHGLQLAVRHLPGRPAVVQLGEHSPSPAQARELAAQLILAADIAEHVEDEVE